MPVAPPRPKGPALNALRAFEAAARLGSFVAAAEELGVTPGAVSQHIKGLEGWTGVTLFQRNAQGIVPTSAALALLPGFEAAFDALGVATQALREVRLEQEIHIAALPCIAQLWLPTRLEAIRRQFPKMRLSVTALETAPNLSRSLFDVSLFFEDPGTDSAAINRGQDRLVPVCAPSVAAGLKRPEDLWQATRLHDQTWLSDWPDWARGCGFPAEGLTEGPVYSLYSLAVEEAKSGAGVLMGHRDLLAAPLASGALVAPFDLHHPSSQSLILRRRRGGPQGHPLDQVLALLK